MIPSGTSSPGGWDRVEVESSAKTFQRYEGVTSRFLAWLGRGWSRDCPSDERRRRAFSRPSRSRSIPLPRKSESRNDSGRAFAGVRRPAGGR